MDIQTYSILAMIGRYILVVLCFLVFIQAILEIRKANQYNNSMNLASLKWSRKRIVFSLGQENIIGRSNKCDIIIKSPFVKRKHFRLYLDCDEWILEPYKNTQVSINKFTVEGKAQVQDGDKISLGKENMIFNITPQDDEEIDDED